MKFLLLWLALVPSAFAGNESGGGGDHVNNGGGLAEQNFLYAYDNLDNWLETCREVQNTCRLGAKESAILGKIQFELRQVRKEPGLIFKSGRLNPGLFETDEHGKVRVAVTGSRAGDPIYLNLDLIYHDAAGSEAAIDVYGAVAILVHELGHHAGEEDHLFLDVLGNKVRNRREQFRESIDLKKYLHPEFRAVAHNSAREIREYFSLVGNPVSRFTLENGEELWDLTDAFTAYAVCPAGTDLRATHLTNITWHRLADFNKEAKRQAFTLSLDLDFNCRGGSERQFQSVRLEWTGQFRVMERTAAGDLVETSYPEDWQIRDRVRFSLVDSAITVR